MSSAPDYARFSFGLIIEFGIWTAVVPKVGPRSWLRLEKMMERRYNGCHMLIYGSIALVNWCGRAVGSDERITRIIGVKAWTERSLLNRVLTGVLVVAIVGAIGTLFYVIANPVEEKYTEFAILGRGGKAVDYPREFVMSGGEVVMVGYEGSEGDIRRFNESRGRVILQIVNREQQEVSYRVEVLIDGEKVKVSLDGQEGDGVGPLLLTHEERWEQEVSFTPQHIGDKQKVEFVLYKDGQPYFEEPLYLWIDVRS